MSKGEEDRDEVSHSFGDRGGLVLFIDGSYPVWLYLLYIPTFFVCVCPWQVISASYVLNLESPDYKQVCYLSCDVGL